ncbi:Ubiquinone/menaquinone biosynthesis C-methylase UbiE [Nonomuraea solani]|uniref:Ubiquinone/menaquinone biosynthesis C-methylase UbiE n=1 Tax=Nonomuraea solani TaxID=1144553 RepID=A0A1H6EEL7_9ACTN|nr:class I SAM-dependent methyltransferase [Nonomuraea solani]SEG95406.1 Ubiquinone/menaquinone biosynthesis C-methylase UbiE [Nonomuraea solani]
MSQFEELAALYEDMALLPWRKDLEIPTVLALIGDLSDRDVLDIGSGSGVYCRRLARQGARRVVGLDEAEGMLEYARSRERAEPLGIEYVAGALPAEMHGAFDLVLGVYVLPYATTTGELLELCRTAAEALRPGGRFVTLPVHPDYHGDPEYYASYGFRLHSEHPREDAAPVTLDLRFGAHDVTVTARYWTGETLEDVLKAAGFSTVEWRNHQVSQAGVAEFGEEFFQKYLSVPHAAILDCGK